MSKVDSVRTLTHPWQASNWSLVLLLVLFVVAILLIDPTGMPQREAPWAPWAMGAMLSAPLSCALIAAWAPQPLVWRAPIAGCACVLIGLTASVKDASLGALLAFSALFVPCGLLLAAVRWLFGWRLGLTGANDEVVGPARRQFNIRYLLAWTVVLAVLLTLSRHIGAGHPLGSRKTWWDSLTEAAKMIAFLGFATAPLLVATTVMLSKQRWSVGPLLLARSVLVLLSVAVGSYLSSLVAMWMEPGVSATQKEVLVQVFPICGGATLAMLLAASVLRWGGYRIARGRPAVQQLE